LKNTLYGKLTKRMEIFQNIWEINKIYGKLTKYMGN